MIKKTVHTLISPILGYTTSRYLTMILLIPAFAGVPKDLNIEFVLVQFALTLSFSLFFYLFFLGIANKSSSKRTAIIGLFFPFYFTFFSLIEKTTLTHKYEDFWVIFIGSLVISFFSFLLVLKIAFDKKESEKQTDTTKTTEPRPPKTQVASFVVAFDANETLTARVLTMKKQLNEAKKLFSDIETLHEIKKMERQLIDSQEMFMSVGELRKKEAETMLETILTTMEADIKNYQSLHDKKQIQGLEKILIQRQK